MLDQIKKETTDALAELLQSANLNTGDVFVVGCSTSEVAGARIGQSGSLEIAEAIFTGLYPILQACGLYLAVQCCEHLNRALVVERELAQTRDLEIVCAIPHEKAGGSLATMAWSQFTDPVLVEEICAKAGIDIGGTLIGMHLAHVAVPVRLKVRQIGEAPIVAARTRPKLIGGERARYE